MIHLLDPDVAIHLRDGTGGVAERLAAISERPSVSIMTWVELEGGIGREPALAARRRAAPDRLLRRCELLVLDDAVVRTYAAIVHAIGFSRWRVIDRVIAATAIVHDLTLLTGNPDDFRAVPGLALQTLAAPAQ